MNNQKKHTEDISRRNFLKTLGVAGVATAGLTAITGCGKEENKGISATEIPTDKMTYRTTPTTGDKVSLLGYGMMRLPNKSQSGDDGNEEIVKRSLKAIKIY